MSEVRKKSVSYEAYHELELKLVSFAQEIKGLIVENRELSRCVDELRLELSRHGGVSSVDMDALLSAIKLVKIPDYKAEMAVLLRGNDLVLQLLKDVLDERRVL